MATRNPSLPRCGERISFFTTDRRAEIGAVSLKFNRVSDIASVDRRRVDDYAALAAWPGDTGGVGPDQRGAASGDGYSHLFQKDVAFRRRDNIR